MLVYDNLDLVLFGVCIYHQKSMIQESDIYQLAACGTHFRTAIDDATLPGIHLPFKILMLEGKGTKGSG